MPEEHGDAATHDVELATLMPDKRNRILGSIRQAIVVEGVESPARSPLFRSILPRIALIAGHTVAPVTLTHGCVTEKSSHNSTNTKTLAMLPKPTAALCKFSGWTAAQ